MVPVSPIVVALGVAAGALALGVLRAPAPPRRAELLVSRSPGAGRRRAPAWFAAVLTELRLSADPGQAWVAVGTATAVAVVMVALAGSPALAVLLTAATLATPSAARRLVEQRQAHRRDEQLPHALEHLATDLRAGSALGPALAALAATTPGPLGAELRALAAEIHHGAGVSAALDRWGTRPRSSREMRLAAAALSLGAVAGGALARSVDGVAATLRERREIHAEVRALATQARTSAAVLAVAPIAFTGLVSGIEPGVVRFLTSSPPGLLCLTAGLALEAVAAVWMARILGSAS